MSEILEILRITARHPRAIIGGVIRSLRWPSAVTLHFEPRDLWVGVYWDVIVGLTGKWIALDVYVCIVPCAPILLTWGVPRDRRTADWSDL